MTRLLGEKKAAAVARRSSSQTPTERGAGESTNPRILFLLLFGRSHAPRVRVRRARRSLPSTTVALPSRRSRMAEKNIPPRRRRGVSKKKGGYKGKKKKKKKKKKTLRPLYARPVPRQIKTTKTKRRRHANTNTFKHTDSHHSNPETPKTPETSETPPKPTLPTSQQLQLPPVK